jgi:organic radical activating enzyme
MSERGNVSHIPSPDTERVKFADILRDPEIAARFEKVRKFFFLRESTYDMTNRCNVHCEGCYYFQGDKHQRAQVTDPAAWRTLLEAEKSRGITFVVLAGAEPSLVPDLLQACYEVIPYGAIASNGFKAIPASVGYKVHLSVWGNDATSRSIRRVPNLLEKQIDNYRGDDRAVFVYTFTPHNIDEAWDVVGQLAQNDCRVTFNMFSAPVNYDGDLEHGADSLRRTRECMVGLMEAFPENVLFSHYNALVHTHEKSLDQLFSCPYPRCNKCTAIGLGRSFRQYRTDHQWDRDAACCVPDTDCDDCRHYAAGSAVVTARMFRHAGHPDTFKAWLDYVDTYLAVWVHGYEKSPNLMNRFVPVPGHD